MWNKKNGFQQGILKKIMIKQDELNIFYNKIQKNQYKKNVNRKNQHHEYLLLQINLKICR